MTREIKYRCWDIESPAMLSWEEIQEDWRTEGYEDAIFRQDHYHVMQFTGLTDRNGVEIYEGDILNQLRADNCYGGPPSNHRIVIDEPEYHDLGDWVSGGADGNRPIIEMEIIGNIHESPELLT